MLLGMSMMFKEVLCVSAWLIWLTMNAEQRESYGHRLLNTLQSGCDGIKNIS